MDRFTLDPNASLKPSADDTAEFARPSLSVVPENDSADFFKRLEQAKLEAMKELAYGASHEINNPLANISTRAQSLLRDESDPERRRKLAAIHLQAMRAHEMIADLMLFARPPKLQIKRLHIEEILSKAISSISPRADSQEIQLLLSPAIGSLEVLGDRTQLIVAVRSVVINALEAVGPGGKVTVDAVELEPNVLQIRVVDNGPGIPPEAREHIFEPFFSGREAGRGLGFGLSKCWRIVTDHAGTVEIACPESGGTEVTLILPLAP